MNATTYPRVVLRPGKEAFLTRRHLWIFSGALLSVDPTIEEGAVVEVFSANHQYLATGHFHRGSIAVRILSFTQRQIDSRFWIEALQAAFRYRVLLGLADNEHTNSYRLVHGEGDNLPGLIIDYYNGIAVIQAHTIGMHRSRYDITAALQAIYGTRLKAVFDKSDLPLKEPTTGNYLFGSAKQTEILENGFRFQVNYEEGQKTGFFLDQRDNRYLLTRYAKDKRVLNAFSYTGGFSVYALGGGAASVDSVDMSAPALALCEINVAINNGTDKHQAIKADVINFLQQSQHDYELIILDPPAFAKSMEARHRAVQGYKRLNVLAFKKMAKKGILFTFSCSQVVSRELFYHTIISAAIEAQRNVRVMHYLSQSADHPVNIFHPEGHYLKGLVLYVE